MHPRNPFLARPPDFAALAGKYPSLKPFVFVNKQGAPSLDFKRPDAVRELTRCLLKDGWGLEVELRADRLCPTVANRLDYLLWIQDLLSSTALPPPSSAETTPEAPSPRVRGIDIGTGSTAVYPLLGCKLDAGWEFFATEIDPDSAHLARGTISRNFLTPRITLVPTASADPLFLPLARDPELEVAFTMCNPPFYASRGEMERLAAGKELAPHAVCTGAETEMITPGGEVAFVQRMITESLALRTRCRWFTSLLGKFSSVPPVVDALRAQGVSNYVLHEFVQGQTRRWAVGWSFGAAVAPDSVGRPASKPLHPYLPPSNTRSFTFPPSASPTGPPFSSADILDAVLPHLRALPGVTVAPFPPGGVHAEGGFVVRAREHSWSRAARRKTKAAQVARSNGDSEVPAAAAEEEEGSLLSCLFTLTPTSPPPPPPPPAGPSSPNPTPSLTLTSHFLAPGRPSAAGAGAPDVPARRLAWDGLWLHVLRKARDALLPGGGPAAGGGKGDVEMR